MGIYVNPRTMTKEAWLAEFATKVSLSDLASVRIRENDEVKVLCWVYNGPFTALAVCFSQAEFEVFADPSDPRPKMWFLASERDVKEANTR